MTNNIASTKDKDFTIPKEIRDYYESEFVCAIEKPKQFVKIKRSHLQSLEVSFAEFKKMILKPILDELEEANILSQDEKKCLIEFRSKMEFF